MTSFDVGSPRVMQGRSILYYKQGPLVKHRSPSLLLPARQRGRVGTAKLNLEPTGGENPVVVIS